MGSFQISARHAGALLAGAMLLAAAGCGNRNVPVTRAPAPEPTKEVVVATPPPPAPKPQAPVIDVFAADPPTMERGQSATLRWAVTGATEVTIDQGLGAVQASGSRQVFPSSTLTYTLTATSELGTDQRSVTVTVVAPPPPPPPTKPQDNRSITEILTSEAQDVHFAYDSDSISADGERAVQANAALLQRIFAQDPTFNVVLEGHCDERGSSEYNLGLGDRRATTVRMRLIELGVPGDRIRTLSYGEERPVCTDTTEACYQQNRRAHLSPAQ